MTEAYSKKKRNTNRKIPKRIMLFAVEGGFLNKTEKRYFERFESDYFVVKFVKKSSSDPEGMVKSLLKEYKEMELSSKRGDIGFSLVDTDFNSTKDVQLSCADKFVSKYDYLHQIVSSPIFEIWYLTHFNFSTKQYNNQEELINTLKTYIKDYSKNKQDVYDILVNKTDIAVKNCKKLYQHNMSIKKKPHTVDFSPYSEIYKVVEMLKNNLDFDDN